MKMPLDAQKSELEKINSSMIDEFTKIAGKSVENPFFLVSEDLERTKDFATNNILKTHYTQIEEASLYNLKLKGKNFRSAILFTIARAMHAQNPDKLSNPELDKFENTKQYDQVVALAACIEIAHNASLLQDDIIDRADSRRSQQAAHKVFGPSTSVFASDFMISRASRMLTYQFDNSHIS